MARDIQISWLTYVPKWDGNDKDKDPISVEIRPLLHRAMGEVLAMNNGSLLNKDSDQYQMSEKIFNQNVRNCKNLAINGVKIESAEDLWKKAPFELTSDIFAFLTQQSQLSKEEKKT